MKIKAGRPSLKHSDQPSGSKKLATFKVPTVSTEVASVLDFVGLSDKIHEHL